MPTKNILYLMYDLERGGPEMRLLDLAMNISCELKIFICVTTENMPLLRDFQKLGVYVKCIPISRPYLEVRKIMDIARLVRHNGISIINCFDLKGLIISTFIKFLFPGKVQTVLHCVNSIITITSIQEIFYRLLMSFTDWCICNSIFSKQQIERGCVTKGKIRVIYNGVDIHRFKPDALLSRQTRAELCLSKDDLVIGTVANFRKQKNYPFLIDAFRTLKETHENLKLLLVGGGPQLNDVKKIAINFGIQDDVLFAGYSPDVVNYINAMDIFVLCSSFEGLPNAILQAMSIGIPVISSAVGGCPEIIEHLTNGMLYAPGDKHDFTQAVKRLIDDKDLASRLALNARHTIDTKFSLNDMVSNYSLFFNKPHGIL
ncbi:MAG: glycosyltransferase [Anaerolineaceae bacterium]